MNREGKILSNISRVFRSPTGGMKPYEASEHHHKAAPAAVRDALTGADVNIDELDLIGFSQGPGLGSTLLAGAVVARKLSIELEAPLMGVNHPIAHVEIGRLATEARDPLSVFVSGANTQIVVNSFGRYRILGETLDIGLGNAQEKLGRELGLPFPAGAIMDQIEGDWIDLPYTIKGMDLAFSGIVTEAMRRHKKGQKKEDVIRSFQEVTFSMLVEASERALAYSDKQELLLVGGVAASARLKEKMELMCEERGVAMKVPPPELVRDNGAMIAWTAILAERIGKPLTIEESAIKTRWRIDEVDWPLLPLT